MQSAASQDDVARGSLVGLVVAGGRSVRFGGEKAVACLAGRPLLLWAVERLARSCHHVAVNARPGTAAEALAREHALPVIHDLPGDPDGPLAGVRAGLQWALSLGATHLAVSPCDVPLAPADLYSRLWSAAGAGAALAHTPEGRQPLCAVWPTRALPHVASAIAGGAHPPTWRVLEQLGAAPVLFDSPACFANLNTQDDLALFEARLAAGSTP